MATKKQDPDEIVHAQVAEGETPFYKTSRTALAPRCRSGVATSTALMANTRRCIRTTCPTWRAGSS